MHTEQGRLPRYQSRILKGKWEFSRQSVLVEHLGEETMMDKRAQEKELMGFFLDSVSDLLMLGQKTLVWWPEIWLQN